MQDFQARIRVQATYSLLVITLTDLNCEPRNSWLQSIIGAINLINLLCPQILPV